VTGASGLIGSHITQLAPALAGRFDVIGFSSAELDLTNKEEVARRFISDNPALIIHCAALSRTGQCEADPARAWALNLDASTHLAQLAHEIPFFFFSTDLVFDGEKGAYREGDLPNPQGVYAETKWAAEQVIAQNIHHTIIRTTLTGGTSPRGNRGFDEILLTTWREGSIARLFVDEYRTPIMADVTAKATWDLVHKKATGTFHLAGIERLTRLETGQLLADLYAPLQPKIESLSIDGFPGPPRPGDISLNCEKIQSILSFNLPTLTDSLTQYHHQWE
jgi:dTDP-4-dehydrorhamnose reductase